MEGLGGGIRCGIRGPLGTAGWVRTVALTWETLWPRRCHVQFGHVSEDPHHIQTFTSFLAGRDLPGLV